MILSFDIVTVSREGLSLADNPILSAVPFKLLIKRDKTPTKETAIAELCLIWYLHHIKSPGVLKGDAYDKRFKDGINIFGLLDWKRDDVFDVAEEFFVSESKSLFKETMTDLLRALSVTRSYINKVIENLEEELPTLKKEDYSKYKSDIEYIYSLAGNIPSRLEQISKVNKLVEAELSGKVDTARGGGDVLDSYDIDNEIETE